MGGHWFLKNSTFTNIMKLSIKTLLFLVCIKECLSASGSSESVSDNEFEEDSSNGSVSDISSKEYSSITLPGNADKFILQSKDIATILSEPDTLDSLLNVMRDLESGDSSDLDEDLDENDRRFLETQMPKWQEKIWDSQLTEKDWTKCGIDNGPLPYEVGGLPWYRNGSDKFRSKNSPNPIEMDALLRDL